MTDASRSALILIEYVNDWLSPTGGIYPAFQDREQVDTAVANSKIILEEARHVVRERAGGSSVFVGTTLDGYLRNNRIFDIYLAGFSLRQCVESSMRNAHDLGYNTNVIYDASSGYTRKQQDDFVAEIAPFYANAITTQTFLAQA